MMRLTAFIASLLVALAMAVAAAAQSPFAPRVIVNDRVITNFEVQQRARFLEIFNTPGDLEAEAVERLIEERLQLFAAERAGIRPNAEQIAAGMAEFAARADMSADEFVQALAEVGIAEESFRDFVIAGISWRELVGQRFASRVSVSDAEVDRARSLTARRASVRLLLSEIVLPDTPEFSAQSRELAGQIAQITSFDAFADAARRYSASDSAERGGRIDWVPLENMPEEVGPMLMQMRPGQVTPPIPSGDALILFQLRDIQRSETLAPDSITVEYARVRIPAAGSSAARSEIARLRAQADTCRDLAGLVPSQPEERFSLENRTLAEVPTDVALELAKLDEGEMSSNLREGGSNVLLMLCARVPSSGLRPSRDDLRAGLNSQRVEAMAQGYLEELRANAHIRRP